MSEFGDLPEQELTHERLGRVREALQGEIRATRSNRARVPAAVALGIALVAVSAGGAAAWLTSGRADDATTAWCYPTTDIERGEGWTGTQVAYVADQTDAPLPSAVDACAAAWTVGAVTNGASDGQVPTSLVACLLPESGEAAVFPARSCAALGLPELIEGTTTRNPAPPSLTQSRP